MPRFGHSYSLLEFVDSTSNSIAERAQSGNLSEGAAILSFDQRAGRGQRGRQWSMSPGKDIAVSYWLKPDTDAQGLVMLNKSLSLGVRDAIQTLCNKSVRIKWPNDIFIDEHKVAGILMEPSWQGSVCKQVVFGLGINVNSSRAELMATATSLFEASGRTIALMDVFKLINEHLSAAYVRAFESQAFAAIAKEYDSMLLAHGREVTYASSECENCIGILSGVDAQGALVIEGEQGFSSFPHGAIHIKDYNLG